MAGRFDFPIDSAFDANGDPISGAKLNFYETGTSTPQDTYSDDALTVANANPVVADSAGRFGDIFLTSADYKVVLTDADDVTIWTADPVRSPAADSTVVLGKTTTYTVSTSDKGKLIAADATGGAFTITLPAAATAGDGFLVEVIKIDSSSNAVTVDADGSETINGDADFALSSQYAWGKFRTDGTTWYTGLASNAPLPRGFIDGFIMSMDSDADHDMAMAAGEMRNAGNTKNVALASSLIKQIDAAWAQGTNQGGLFTGTVAADTTYHAIVIENDTTGDIDWGWDTDAAGSNKPSGWTVMRRVGSRVTDSSSNLIPTTQRGDYVSIDEHPAVQALSSVSNTASAPSTHAVDAAPVGIVARLEFVLHTADTQATSALNVMDFNVTSVQGVDSAVARGPGNASISSNENGYGMAWSNTSAQIKAWSDGGNNEEDISIRGWLDPRGKDS